MESDDIYICSPPEYRLIKESFLKSLPFQMETVITFVLVTYMLFVLIGPKFMKIRQPLDLKKIITAYNIGQIAFNSLMVYMYISLGGFKAMLPWRNICCPISYEINYSINDITKAFLLALLYSVNKSIDLLETVFFILRKKNSQLTFLHVYHHAVMVVGSYYSLIKTNEEVFLSMALFNCIVHLIMYIYYFMSAYQAMRPYLGWKKYLTSLQIIQFVFYLFLIALFSFSKCSKDPAVFGFWGLVVLSFCALFSRFYVVNYLHKK